MRGNPLARLERKAEKVSSCVTTLRRNVLLADSMQSVLVLVQKVLCVITICTANLLASSFGATSFGAIVKVNSCIVTVCTAIERRGIDGKVTRGAAKGRGRQRHETKVNDIKRGERNKTKYTVCSPPNKNLESHMLLKWGL